MKKVENEKRIVKVNGKLEGKRVQRTFYVESVVEKELEEMMKEQGIETVVSYTIWNEKGKMITTQFESYKPAISKWSDACKNVIKELKKNGLVTFASKELYNEIKEYCKENNVAATGRWAGRSYKVVMK